MAAKGLLNPVARAADARGLFSGDDYAALRTFYDRRPELAPTPLRRLSRLAASLGLADLLVKDESARFGLNAFKVLGVRFAVERILQGGGVGTLACATAGNHGRAVARVARELGLAARVYVPAYTTPDRIEAIAREGAQVVVFDGSYDEAVRASAADAAREGWTIVSDTGWPGYEDIPRSIMLGYARLMDECAVQWTAVPRVIVVQAGVGGLAAAVLSWLAFRFGGERPFTIVAEPASAACVMASLEAGRPRVLSGSLDTIMAGLRCGEVSTAAWPALGLADACVAVDDAAARRAIGVFANPTEGDPPIDAGPSGACGLAALLAVCEDGRLAHIRRAAEMDEPSDVLLVNTEGGSGFGTPVSHE